MQEVFTPGRLKEYESWLMVQRKLSLNTVSTYMRTLQAVYNRWMPLGSGDYNPKLFDDVYTKVESHIKRALTEQQMKLIYDNFIKNNTFLFCRLTSNFRKYNRKEFLRISY